MERWGSTRIRSGAISSIRKKAETTGSGPEEAVRRPALPLDAAGSNRASIDEFTRSSDGGLGDGDGEVAAEEFDGLGFGDGAELLARQNRVAVADGEPCPARGAADER